jgi:hypothetical protein
MDFPFLGIGNRWTKTKLRYHGHQLLLFGSRFGDGLWITLAS